MSDLNDQLRRYIDGLEEPVSMQETMARRSDRRFRVPAAVLAGAAVVLIPAMVLVGLRWLPGGGHEVVDTSIPPVSTSTIVVDTTTTLVETTTAPPEMVVVPDLNGFTEAQARSILSEIGLEIWVTERYPSRSGFGLIAAQSPMPGEEIEPGRQVLVAVWVRAECLDYESDLEDAGSTTVQVLFECAADWSFPDVSTPITRVVAETSDPIEATLRELLAGPTGEELNLGFTSWFSSESADALNSVALDGGRLTVDFNDSILINNVSTSTGGMFFMAELQANLFQFPEVDSIEFRRNGSCDGFWGMMESTCEIVTRNDWEERVAAWNAERALQPEPGEVLGIADLVGKTFTTELHNDSQAIMASHGGDFSDDLYYAGFTEIGGWLLDDATGDDLRNWALHVTGQNAEMIWLVESIGHTDEGSMIYTVRAVLEIPWQQIEAVMQGDPFVRDGATACTRNGLSDPRLVVVAEVAETGGVISDYMNPLLAWLIDIEDGGFVEIPVDGVECLFDLS